MDQLVAIGVPTGIACLGVFFIVMFVDFVTAKVWTLTSNKWVRGSIKWVWTMWLPLWPIAIGGLGGILKGMPLPDAVSSLGPYPGPVSVIYGAFCGMISMAVVKAIKHALEQKGIDVEIPDLSVAKLLASKDKTASKLQGKKDSTPPPPPDQPADEDKPA